MIKKSKCEVREMLMKHASQNTPDLWGKIEPQLESRPQSQTAVYSKKNYLKPIYRYTVAGFIILLVGAVAVAYVFKTPSITNIQSSTSPLSSSSSSVSSFTPSPVLFSSLRFPNSSNQLTLNGDPSGSMSLASFSEKNVLKQSEIICKATVVNSYVKQYKYDTYSDKFKKNGRLHQIAETIVYEIKIEDLYYNKTNIIKAGDTIKVEENTWVGTSISGLAFVLQQNHQYILNLYDVGETIPMYGDKYTSGNIKRDGRYGICYPFAPQIEITLDQQYVFHDRWESLINDKTAKVVVDTGNLSGLAVYYADSMKLRQDKEFISDYKKMIAKYK